MKCILIISGHALKPPTNLFGLLADGIKKMYITKLKGFDINTMCVATLLFEGKYYKFFQFQLHLIKVNIKI